MNKIYSLLDGKYTLLEETNQDITARAAALRHLNKRWDLIAIVDQYGILRDFFMKP